MRGGNYEDHRTGELLCALVTNSDYMVLSLGLCNEDFRWNEYDSTVYSAGKTSDGVLPAIVSDNVAFESEPEPGTEEEPRYVYVRLDPASLSTLGDVTLSIGESGSLNVVLEFSYSDEPIVYSTTSSDHDRTTGITTYVLTASRTDGEPVPASTLTVYAAEGSEVYAYEY